MWRKVRGKLLRTDEARKGCSQEDDSSVFGMSEDELSCWVRPEFCQHGLSPAQHRGMHL
jgi:hypothetical protein